MRIVRWLSVLLCIWGMGLRGVSASEPLAKHVVLISFDGLRSDAITTLGPKKAYAFYTMMEEGATTLNARTDYDYTVTLPNHTCMLTGIGVLGPKGHHVTDNKVVTKTIHEYAGRQVVSIFDVVNQHKMHSAMLASKIKFNIYEHSFPIDTVSITNHDDFKTLKSFQKLAQDGLPNFVFMHFSNPDHVGHAEGWDVSLHSPYMKEVRILNGHLAKIIHAINSNPSLKKSTVIIVTADHGGEGRNHSDNTKLLNYRIPFLVWGGTVAKGQDLYKINSDRRKDPLDESISYDEEGQPIRNGDAANLAVSLLGLPFIEGSTIGFDQPLKINEVQN